MNINVVVEQPLYFLLLIPALALGIIPFVRLRKKRRKSSKHLIPFIIHLVLVLVLCSLLAGIKVTETREAPTDNSVVFVVDVSGSNAAMIQRMDDHIHELMQASDLSITKFGLIAFGGEQKNAEDEIGIVRKISIGNLIYKRLQGTDDDGNKIPRYLNLGLGDTMYEGSDIASALSSAKTLLEREAFATNKRVVLLSDGKETTNAGDAMSAARQLNQAGIKVDASYFDITKDNEQREAQLVSLSTEGKVSYGDDLKFSVIVKTTRLIPNATIRLYDVTGKILTQKTETLAEGASQVSLTYSTKGNNAIDLGSVNVVRAELEIRDDVIEQNNELYSWFTVDPVGSILVVDGDGTQMKQYNKVIDFEEIGYEIKVIKPYQFPDCMEALLEYDEIVLMNVDLAKTGYDEEYHLPQGAEARITRFVEENGRSMLFTCGDNIYNYTGAGSEESNNYVDSALNDILPVHLKVDKERQTVAMVLVVDLSSSMKAAMSGKTRYQVLVENVKDIVTEGTFDENDLIGVVAFDQDFNIALPMQTFGDSNNRQEIAKEIEYNLNHHYYLYYLDKDGKETDIPVIHIDDVNDAGETILPGTPGDPYYDKYGYTVSKDWDSSRSNQIDPVGYTTIVNGEEVTYKNIQIQAYGTSYKWAIQAASDMLSKASNKTTLEIKQVVIMSDGEPNDKGSGYDGIIERMAKSGTVTSTIFIGSSKEAISELETLASLGKGDFFDATTSTDLKENLSKIADSIQGKYFNDGKATTPKKNALNSVIHEGLGDDFDYSDIYGYYGTTYKEGTLMPLYVDTLKPLYAEWEYGNGKVAVFMSDLGNVDWTGPLFDTSTVTGATDEEIQKGIDAKLRFVQNIITAPMNRRIDSTGLEHTIVRTDDKVIININTYAPLREAIANIDQYQEMIRVTVYEINKETGEIAVDINNEKVAYAKGYVKSTSSRKHVFEFPATSRDQLFEVKIEMLKVVPQKMGAGGFIYIPIDEKPYNAVGKAITDTTTFAVVGTYADEYDVFSDATGQTKINTIASSGKGKVLTLSSSDDSGKGITVTNVSATDDGESATKTLKEYFGERDEKPIDIPIDVVTPFIIAALILFLLDIVFRNFVIKKKEENNQMTDEQQIESMRGR